MWRTRLEAPALTASRFGWFPSIASWVVQANGFAAYNKTVSKMTSLVSAGARWTAGKAWAGAKGAGSAALSGGKAVGRGIMNGARLIFRK